MSKYLLPLVVVAGILIGIAPSTQAAPAPVVCPPGQTLVGNYCQAPPAACSKLTAKLSLLRATFSRLERTIDILAPITHLASGNASIALQAAGRTTSFTAPVDSARGRIAAVHSVSRAQARLGTGILNIFYPGDADTRSQFVRLRAANNPADLVVTRPTISAAGALVASGSVTSRAHGVVRVQLQYINRADGQTVTLERQATIHDGTWSLNSPLGAAILAQIAGRCGTLHSYTLFTGYLPRRIRGEMRSYQVLPSI